MMECPCNMVLRCLGLLVILVVCFYAYMKYKKTYWKRRGIRSVPGGHWFLGHLKDVITMKKSPSVMLGDMYQMGRNEDRVLGIYMLWKPILLVRDPELIKHILIKDFSIFPNHHFSGGMAKDKVTNSNLFNIHYPEWKHLRMKMTPTFTTGKIKKLFILMTETGDSMKEYFEKQFTDGSKTKPIAIRDTVAKYTTDVISTLAFGLRTNSLIDPPPDFFVRSRQFVKLSLFQALRLFCMLFFPSAVRYLGGQLLGPSTDYFRRIFWESMIAREQSKVKRGDILDSLIELKNEEQDTSIKFEGDVLLAQSAIFFVAGRETTITTTTFSLCELARHPEIQKRTRQEILENLEKYGFTYEGVQEMKYLFQVISETLRMYAPAPFIDRVASEDYKIPGSDVVIEKGTPVFIALHGLHYDERYHPDPTRFDPDRFSDEKKNEIVQCTYMPFGEGPRVCIGMRVGLLQTAVAIITVLKDYEVSLHPDHPVKIDPRNVFTVPPEGFLLNFTRLAKLE